MEEHASNRYRFSSEVVEVIHKDGVAVIKVVTNPGTMIIETSCDSPVKLGDRLTLTGDLVITSIEEECIDGRPNNNN